VHSGPLRIGGAADQQGGLAVAVADPQHPGDLADRVRVAARARQQAVAGEQLVDLAGEPDPSGGEQDQVVADPLQLGDDVGGQHHGEAVLDRRAHQRLHELAAGERVQAGDRLVQQQQPRPLGQRHGKGDLGLLAAGELAGALGERDAEVGKAPLGQRLVPGVGQVQPPAHGEQVGDGEALVERVVLGNEPDPGERGGGVGAGGLAEHPHAPSVGVSSPATSWSRVVLPAPLGPTSAMMRPCGTARVQSRRAHSRP
jgi:hypothetical protein